MSSVSGTIRPIRLLCTSKRFSERWRIFRQLLLFNRCETLCVCHALLQPPKDDDDVMSHIDVLCCSLRWRTHLPCGLVFLCFCVCCCCGFWARILVFGILWYVTHPHSCFSTVILLFVWLVVATEWWDGGMYVWCLVSLLLCLLLLLLLSILYFIEIARAAGSGHHDRIR